MKEKIKHIFYSIIHAFIIAGIIIFLIGLYYAIIKAGIPYQDPPLELQIQYAINEGIGSVLVGSGFRIIVCSSVIWVVLSLIDKKRRKKK